MKLEIVSFSDGKFGVRKTLPLFSVDRLLGLFKYRMLAADVLYGGEVYFFANKEYWEKNCHFNTIDDAKNALDLAMQRGEPRSSQYDIGTPVA